MIERGNSVQFHKTLSGGLISPQMLVKTEDIKITPIDNQTWNYFNSQKFQKRDFHNFPIMDDDVNVARFAARLMKEVLHERNIPSMVGSMVYCMDKSVMLTTTPKEEIQRRVDNFFSATPLSHQTTPSQRENPTTTAQIEQLANQFFRDLNQKNEDRKNIEQLAQSIMSKKNIEEYDPKPDMQPSNIIKTDFIKNITPAKILERVERTRNKNVEPHVNIKLK